MAQRVRLLAVRVWLLKTLVLFTDYATQGPALDRGKLVVVQSLLATTIVWAPPLARGAHLSERRAPVLGAVVVVIALALFILVGDPDAGVDNASTRQYVIATLSRPRRADRRTATSNATDHPTAGRVIDRRRHA
jgi:hypothetical protein